MAEIIAPAPRRSQTSWLDRPLFPTWQRVIAHVASWELAAYTALVAVGFVLRIWDVGARALHHDESLHSYYSWLFYTGHGYSYDPLMHGPLQFEVVPLFYLVFGDSEFSARLLAVVLGTALIVLPFFLRSYLTRPGALLASLMLTVSPSLVYYSRFIRDDIYLACFSLILFIGIVKYLEDRSPRYLYISAAAMALAMASMEAAYLTFFIFGTFLIFQAVREYAFHRDGPVLSAIRQTSLDTWLTALSIFVILTVLFYSTFFTNPYGIWDTQHALTSPDRKDILGGLLYWKAQHYVQRGGQPWFYYLLLLPLYEQLALLFGIAGAIYAVIRRSFVRTFLVWWAAGAFGLYSWAGEKMPWLVIHIALPLILLAGLFLGRVFRWRSTRYRVAAFAAFIILLIAELHGTFVLNYVDGANPTEMLIYVQTAQDVPNVSAEIKRLSEKTTGGTTMPVGLDNADVGGWPFIWYLRDFPNITETSVFNGPICNGQYCPVLLMLGPEYQQYAPSLMQHYVAQKYKWNWWFPEDYKEWFPQHWGAFWSDLRRGHPSVSDLLGTSGDWSNIWNWFIYRRPFGQRSARDLYFLVRRDLVPHAQYYATHVPGGAAVPQLAASTLPSHLIKMEGATAGPGALSGPVGIATAPDGRMYVANPLSHTIAVFSASGKPQATWGGAGTGPGLFSATDSPQGLAAGPDGNVYVADTWNHRIEVFSADGHFVRQWGSGAIGTGAGQFYGPRSVSVASNGHVYVADTGNRRIQVFTSKGKYLFAFGSQGTGPGQFQEPSSVAVAPDGTVYVADFWNQRIQVFTPSGTFLRSWPVSDWTARSYSEPYLAVDAKTGWIVASDPLKSQVLVYTSNGHLLGGFGGSQLLGPIGVAVLQDGSIAVSDPTANHVDIFSVQVPKVSPTPKRP